MRLGNCVFIPGTTPNRKQDDVGCYSSKTSLPILSPEFHGKDYEQFHSELNKALEQLAEIRKVEVHFYTWWGAYPSITKRIKVSKPHLMMWSNTLPLVLERLLPKIADSKVKIYIERVYPLEPGSRPMAASLQDIELILRKTKQKTSNLLIINFYLKTH